MSSSLASNIKSLQAEETAVRCPAIDQLIESSKTLDNGEPAWEYYHLVWMPYSEFKDIELVGNFYNQTIYYAKRKRTWDNISNNEVMVMLLLLGTNSECTQEAIHNFARVHSLPTHKYRNP